MLTHYYRELLNFLSQTVRNRDVAADLTQESFARVLAAQQAGQVIRNPRALLYRTARNLVIDQHRRAEVRAEGPPAVDDDPPPDADQRPGPKALQPEAILASRQGLAAVLATIDGLPPRCREAFVLFKFDGCSYAEIAARMGISVRTVEMQLQIAMAACWRCLEELEGAAEPSRRRWSRHA